MHKRSNLRTAEGDKYDRKKSAKEELERTDEISE